MQAAIHHDPVLATLHRQHISCTAITCNACCRPLPDTLAVLHTLKERTTRHKDVAAQDRATTLTCCLRHGLDGPTTTAASHLLAWFCTDVCQVNPGWLKNLLRCDVVHCVTWCRQMEIFCDQTSCLCMLNPLGFRSHPNFAGTITFQGIGELTTQNLYHTHSERMLEGEPSTLVASLFCGFLFFFPVNAFTAVETHLTCALHGS